MFEILTTGFMLKKSDSIKEFETLNKKRKKIEKVVRQV